jgi:hypothetical protein
VVCVGCPGGVQLLLVGVPCRRRRTEEPAVRSVSRYGNYLVGPFRELGVERFRVVADEFFRRDVGCVEKAPSKVHMKCGVSASSGTRRGNAPQLKYA